MRCMVLWAYPKRPRTDAGLSTPRPGSPKQDAEGCRETPVTPPNHGGNLYPAEFWNRLKCVIASRKAAKQSRRGSPHTLDCFIADGNFVAATSQ
ncbi:MAG: hypothetical protein LBT00_09555 [Spirochaetaceae bacterium]|nr:hypothetical protein [Spirochaetaceae bacterium]